MRLFSMVMMAVLALSVTACGEGAGGNTLEITKTSDNTWTIYDPDSAPDQYLDKTCATQGREVRAITAPGEAYQWLYVVCQPKGVTAPTAPPTTTDPDSFSP